MAPRRAQAQQNLDEPEPSNGKVRTKGDNRRIDIVNRAAALFDAGGSTNSTMDEIAAAVGIAKPTLYHYFSSKNEILFEIHQAFIDVLVGRHTERLRTPAESRFLLAEAMGDIFELMDTHRGHVRVFFEFYRQLPEPYRTTIKAKRDLYHSMIEDVIRLGISAGELRKVDPTLTTIAVFGMCNWSHLELSRAPGRPKPRQIAHIFCDYFVQGIRAT